MILAYIAVIVIIIILSYWRWSVSTTAQLNEQFINGFWCADQTDCDIKGYKEAFLYIEKGGASYIIAIQGANGNTINCPFKLHLNSGATAGKCVAKDFTFDAHIKCDMPHGVMTWTTPCGEHIFTWIKNCEMSRKVSSI